VFYVTVETITSQCDNTAPKHSIIANGLKREPAFISEVLTAMNMPMSFFWFVTSCGLADRDQRFGEMYLLYLQL
jgi:hypothetical protein